MSRTLMIGCGGCGGEIINKFEYNPNNVGYGEVIKLGIDTISQLKNPNFETIILPGDGAGQDSKDGFRLVLPHIKTIMRDRIPDAELTIINTSACGGTGNPTAFLLAKELLKLDRLVVMLIVFSSDSSQQIENGSKFYASLQRMAKEVGKSLPVIWLENTPEEPQSKIDQYALTMLRFLTILNSGENHGLDDNDIYNWINVDVNTVMPPQLLDLVITLEQDGGVGKGWDSETMNAITALSLLKSTDVPKIDVGAAFHPHGYLPAGLVSAKNGEFANFHFYLTNSLIPGRVAYLQDIAKQAKLNELAKLELVVPMLDVDDLF